MINSVAEGVSPAIRRPAADTAPATELTDLARKPLLDSQPRFSLIGLDPFLEYIRLIKSLNFNKRTQ
jgi:hypothetical protein